MFPPSAYTKSCSTKDNNSISQNLSALIRQPQDSSSKSDSDDKNKSRWSWSDPTLTDTKRFHTLTPCICKPRYGKDNDNNDPYKRNSILHKQYFNKLQQAVATTREESNKEGGEEDFNIPQKHHNNPTTTSPNQLPHYIPKGYLPHSSLKTHMVAPVFQVIPARPPRPIPPSLINPSP